MDQGEASAGALIRAGDGAWVKAREGRRVRPRGTAQGRGREEHRVGKMMGRGHSVGQGMGQGHKSGRASQEHKGHGQGQAGPFSHLNEGAPSPGIGPPQHPSGLQG